MFSNLRSSALKCRFVAVIFYIFAVCAPETWQLLGLLTCQREAHIDAASLAREKGLNSIQFLKEEEGMKTGRNTKGSELGATMLASAVQNWGLLAVMTGVVSEKMMATKEP